MKLIKVKTQRFSRVEVELKWPSSFCLGYIQMCLKYCKYLMTITSEAAPLLHQKGLPRKHLLLPQPFNYFSNLFSPYFSFFLFQFITFDTWGHSFNEVLPTVVHLKKLQFYPRGSLFQLAIAFLIRSLVHIQSGRGR